MNSYIDNYDSFNEKIIYNFKVGDGGLADNIKFFIVILESCMKNNIRLYYKKNNITIEKYNKMYIDENQIKQLSNVKFKTPYMYYSTKTFNYSIDIKDVFYFTDEVKTRCTHLFPSNIINYISIHLRLGDKYLETDENYLQCKNDVRSFSEEKLYEFIEKNYNKNIFFCCDNNNYKLKIKEKYNNIIITNCLIGHTSLSNTTEQQVLDAITELYILTNSEMIISASMSGFSMVASKFNNIPLIELSTL